MSIYSMIMFGQMVECKLALQEREIKVFERALPDGKVKQVFFFDPDGKILQRDRRFDKISDLMWFI